MSSFAEIPPVAQALIAGIFCWAVGAVGSAVVFFTERVNQKLIDMAEGFASGVMIAACFWSLLAPAIAMTAKQGSLGVSGVAGGFLAGGAFLWGCDKILPHLHRGLPTQAAEGIQTGWSRNVLLVLAITLHNVPEGLAVGIAFGAVASDISATTLPAAIALAVGIGVQNFPEGMAVSLPLRREGVSRWKCFLYGQASTLVEPMAAVIGASAVVLVKPLLPYALSFAAGAMLFVVIEELIPESHRGENHDSATLAALAGFAAMMLLDVAFK